MKKHMMGMALVAAMGLLAACGGGSDEPAETAATPPAETTASEADTAETASAPQPEAEEVSASAAFEGFPEPYASADYDRGRRVYYQCQSCHSVEEGGAAVLGPNLYGLFSRKVGGLDSFEYSDALEEADFDWTPEKLDEWLASPRSFLPGNRMSFAGVQRPDDRTAVIAYVMAESGYTP